LKDGKVIEKGTHEELNNLHGYYSQLCTIQGMSDEIEESKQKGEKEIENEVKNEDEDETEFSAEKHQETGVFRKLSCQTLSFIRNFTKVSVQINFSIKKNMFSTSLVHKEFLKFNLMKYY
jgi:hypothetical protein